MPNGLRSRGARARLGLLLAIAALTACATTNKSPLASATPVEREFALAAVTWDLNKDGDVTCDEWKQYVTGLFRDADANHDGFLTRQEFAALARTDRLFEVAGFDYFDANADGRLTLAEITEKPNPAFQLLDKNGDCVISADERLNQRGESGAKSQGGRRKQ
jgi:EF hand domain-containing protein